MIKPIGKQSSDLPKLRETPMPDPSKGSPSSKKGDASPVRDAGVEDKIINNRLRFSVDEAAGRVIIKVVNPESGEVIRQIPPEELVALSKMLKSFDGNLIDLFS